LQASDTRIGDDIKRGISGGERKRVSIGIEMLAEPAVIILDEPTSGLDAATAAMLIETLRDIATDERRTVRFHWGGSFRRLRTKSRAASVHLRLESRNPHPLL
jgi:Fe-S cluster assembly ATPase SufC